MTIKRYLGIAWATNGVDCFNLSSIKAMIPLCRLPSSSAPTYSPAWCWATLCKHLSSTFKMRSVEIWSSSRKTFTAFNESTPPHLVASYSELILKTMEIFQIGVYMLGEMCVLNLMRSESLKLRTAVYP